MSAILTMRPQRVGEFLPTIAARALRAAVAPMGGGVPSRARNRIGRAVVVVVNGPIWFDGGVGGALWGGGTTVGQVVRDIHNADASGADVILLDIHSPGGEPFGMSELVDAVVRAKKPVVAFAHDVCEGAAYALASAADLLVGTPDARVGGIAAVGVTLDSSEADRRAGLRVVAVSTGSAKLRGVPGLPVDESQIKAMQAEVDAVGGRMVAIVEKYRKIKAEAIRAMGGEDFGASNALKHRLIDRVMNAGDVYKMASAGTLLEAPKKSAASKAPSPTGAAAQRSGRADDRHARMIVSKAQLEAMIPGKMKGRAEFVSLAVRSGWGWERMALELMMRKAEVTP